MEAVQMIVEAWHRRVLPTEAIDNPIRATRARVIAGFALVEIVATSAFVLISLLTSGGWYVPFGIIGCLTGVAAMFALRRSQIELAGHLVLVGTAGAAFSGGIFTGGIANPAFAWVFFVPLFAGLLMDSAGATLWGVITGAVALLAVWAHVTGRLPARAYLPMEGNQPIYDVAAMAFVSTLVIRLYQQASFATQERLRDALRGLQVEVDERRVAEDEARAARLSQESFLASISHEIRTPMNGIIGVSELLSRSGLDSDQLGHVEALGHSASTLRRLLTDLLDLSKLRAGGFSMASQSVQIRSTLRAALELQRAGVEGSPVAWEFSCAEDVSSWIVGDEARIAQMVGNLLANAGRFATSKVTLGVEVSGSSLVLTVDDDGPGIPESDREVALAPFQQVPGTKAGTGLGLALVAGLAEAMRGHMRLEASHLGGTRAVVEFPLVAAEPPMSDSGRLRALGCRVLVVDDDSVNRLVLSGMLRSLGAENAEAASGEEGLDLMASQSFDLVLMDLQMPGLSGIETTKIATERGICTPVVCLTAASAARVEEEVRAAGMVGLVTKPVSRAQLAQVLARHLATPTRKGPPSLPSALG